MNYYKSLCSLLILLSLVVGYTSCSEDNDPAKVAESGQMIANVDGQDWVSTTVTALIYNDNIALTGEAADGSQIVLSVAGTAAGTFSVSGALGSIPDNIVSFTPVDADVITNPTYSSTYLDETAIGEIIITEIDATNKTISGTFHCKVSRFLPEEKTIEVKSGSFTKIPYIDDPGSVPDNLFSAKVDGVAFSPSGGIGGISSFGSLVLNFAGSESKAIAITVPSDTGTGTFAFGSILDDYYGAYIVGGSTSYISTSGSITITSHDKTNDRIIGTFSFVGEPLIGDGEVSVTEGSFDVSY